MDTLVKQFKTGYKTTEFWLTILSLVIVSLNGVFGWDLDVEGIVALVAANVSYVLGRSYLKAKRVPAAAAVASEEQYQRYSEQLRATDGVNVAP